MTLREFVLHPHHWASRHHYSMLFLLFLLIPCTSEEVARRGGRSRGRGEWEGWMGSGGSFHGGSEFFLASLDITIMVDWA